MRKFYMSVLVASLFVSCFSEKTNDKSTVYEQEF